MIQKGLYSNQKASIKEDLIKTQEMCDKAVEKDPWQLKYVPDCFKTKRVCKKAVENKPENLRYVPDHLKTEEACYEAVRTNPLLFVYVPDRLKTKEICEWAIEDDPNTLEFVLDWFVTREWVYMWHDKFSEWHDGYQKRKAQKAKIKEDILTFAWHPSRWWNWCVPEDEKKDKGNFGS